MAHVAYQTNFSLFILKMKYSHNIVKGVVRYQTPLNYESMCVLALKSSNLNKCSVAQEATQKRCLIQYEVLL